MMSKLERDQIAAEIATIESLLASLRPNDLLGRIGLQSRRDEIAEYFAQMTNSDEHRAKVALYFGGEPVVGSVGVQARFGARVVGSFQDLISKVWGSTEGSPLAPMGPIKVNEASQLHITNLVHGSFGFLLEEIDREGEPFFKTPLKKAAEQAAEYITSFASENEASFSSALEAMDPRVFQSVRDFFGYVHKGKATLRLVEGERDEKFDRSAVERAWLRAEASKVEEDRITVEGKLLGIIPIGRRFEFDIDNTEEITKGKIGAKFSESYLEKMSTQQFAGRRWKAVLNRKIIEKVGRMPFEAVTLLELEEISL